MMLLRALLVPAVACVVAAGCTAGAGVGQAIGSLFVLSCDEGEDRGSSAQPAFYSLNPRFFAGEPILDVGVGSIRANRLIVRMQKTGRRRELNDVLRFDVTDSYEVARCVRGRIVNGKPDYDERNCAWKADMPEMPAMPRLRVGPDAIVRSYFTPRVTCPSSIVVGTAINRDPRVWDSWIEIVEFGTAVADPGVLPELRQATNRGFRMEFGERLHARQFYLTLDDDKTVKARGLNNPPLAPELGGTLEGFFDFDLQRGQAVQTFP
jgi:hypothetical protein